MGGSSHTVCISRIKSLSFILVFLTQKYYLFSGYSILSKKEPPWDPNKKGYSKLHTVRYFIRNEWHIVACRYYFETKWLRVLNKNSEVIGSLEPIGINQDGFIWKIK